MGGVIIDEDEPGPVVVNVLRGTALEDWLRGGRDADLLIGRGGGDRLSGRAGDDWLRGGAGTDTLEGGAGNDRIAGGAGRDLLTGGAGVDVFVLRHARGVHADTITDFGQGADRLLLAGSLFDGLDTTAFAAAGAETAETRLIWNAATGQLSFDPDGAGEAARRPIATLTPGSDLDTGDLLFG